MCFVEIVNSMIIRKIDNMIHRKTLASIAMGIKLACIAHSTRLLISSSLVRV